jgi:hypothetical protein
LVAVHGDEPGCGQCFTSQKATVLRITALSLIFYFQFYRHQTEVQINIHIVCCAI